jgi:flagellar hook-associated protein 3 FlgL
MRVTANTYSNFLIQQLNRLGTRQGQLQIQATTGQRVQQPEDDPLATRLVLNLKAEGRSVAQYQRNVATEKDRATANYSTMKALKSISDRVGEIATLADDLKSPEELADYANQVTKLIKEGVQLANSKQNASYLFSGTRSNEAPFTMTTDSSGQVTSVAYEGNESQMSVEIAEGYQITTQIVGANATASGPKGLITDAASGADFFNHLISLQNHLAAGDTAAIAATDRANLKNDEENLLAHISENSLTLAQLTSTGTQLQDRAAGLEKGVADHVGVDLAQTMVQLSATTTAYQAALQSSASIMNLSLMAYLR